ncbi:MAG: polyprenyl synthetase family protein [Cytophaga sp.]|uniref:polyprenyl synthetase family protein n=1 Tax=Cytophaga sp. TaxID=29535 RepID=UPI003F821F1A
MLLTTERLTKDITKAISKAEFGKEPAELYEPIRYIMDLGGKRMRPILTLLSNYIFTEDCVKVMDAAVAVEVFHNFTLMHDDIMDNAPLRRGKSTVHEKWNTNIAILSGDVMLVEAYKQLMLVEEKHLKRVLDRFNETAAGVCEGQQLDMNFETVAAVTVDEYINMIRLKTAVLLGFSMELGAILGDADDKSCEYLRTAGESAGIGFQLKDDLLDVYGDAATFGKQVGGDILANKKTFLLTRALEKAEGKTKKELEKLLTDKTISDKAKITGVTAIYDQLEIKAEAEALIEEYFNKAIESLGKVKGSIFRKHYIKNYLLALIGREQ